MSLLEKYADSYCILCSKSHPMSHNEICSWVDRRQSYSTQFFRVVSINFTFQQQCSSCKLFLLCCCDHLISIAVHSYIFTPKTIPTKNQTIYPLTRWWYTNNKVKKIFSFPCHSQTEFQIMADGIHYHEDARIIIKNSSTSQPLQSPTTTSDN